MKSVYIAGPDVFCINAKEIGELLKQKCYKYEFKGLFPLDNILEANSKKELAIKIKNANIELIKLCDIVIANLSPFRGPEPDSGTVWEVGYAQALGKNVVGYSTDMRDLKTRTQDMLGLKNDSLRDLNNLEIEDFNLTHNLMYADIIVSNNFEGCLKYLLKVC